MISDLGSLLLIWINLIPTWVCNHNHYDMSFVSLQSDVSSAIVIEMQYVRSWQIAPIYNATRLYLYLVVCSWSFAWKWNIKLRSHMRGAVAERWQADFDIPALLPQVCSHTRGADAGGSAISWGQRWFRARLSKRTWKIGCRTHLLRSGFYSRSASAPRPRMCERM